LGVVAAFAAGFVDAVVGGGGLIQLPAITLILPKSTATDVILGTNKFAAAAGTSIAAVTYRRRLGVVGELLGAAVVAAMSASFVGARLSSALPKAAFRPIIMVVLAGVLLLTLRRPDLGTRSVVSLPPAVRRRRLLGVAAVVGLYDGMIGPGTGTFFTIALVVLVGFDFLTATATAKVLNVGTNLAALGWFLPHGAIAWSLAVPMAASNLTGGYIGARLALRRGAAFVRVFFVVVVTALLCKLGWDTLQG
jgi:uncharacterized protein